MGTTKKSISFMIILLISILIGYQNCGNFESFGNGDPYEGLTTNDGRGGGIGEEFNDPNGGLEPVLGDPNNNSFYCLADDINGYISSVTIIYDNASLVSRLLIDLKNGNGFTDVDLDFDTIPANQWLINSAISADIFAISFTNESNSPSVFTFRYKGNSDMQESFTCTQVQ